jgi:peroxiredoxin Q/BCP
MLLVFAASLFVVLPTQAQTVEQEKIVDLKEGDRAPHFTGVTDEGEEWDSREHAKKKHFIVYFYPADMTGGCTAQACAYRDALAELERDDVEVIGISGDTVENHQHFKQQYKLNFTLLADPKGEIAKAFGVKTGPGGSFEKMIGDANVTFERGITANRWTFVINKKWEIAHVDREVDAAKDSEKTLKIVEKLP